MNETWLEDFVKDIVKVEYEAVENVSDSGSAIDINAAAYYYEQQQQEFYSSKCFPYAERFHAPLLNNNKNNK